ncbi:hypothetical protein KHS38_12015 [Mucilaginibacter sp. Bleaf8]|uniref:hypothetical protein n=1 Tax=Mucilaginibacter sp. Bleaf8 TaxID=2834430 RepID=UPI001BCEC638|nr:hypothetical protein [Mucilaginibacter sp. Bleaf8]MBS7565130.1 hypothetical protein [Mucilaginibacter sp. Bleaf8]
MAKSKNSNWSKSELTKLRKSLPSNWKETLADKHELSTGTIENIIYGTSKNDDVVLSAVELAKSHKNNILESKEAIKSL